MRKLLPALSLLGLLALPGCHTAEKEIEAESQSKPAARAELPVTDALVNTVWSRADGGGPPGEIRIFLADGTLVQDSCGEVYALRKWRRVSAEEIVMVEDVEIPARIVALSGDDLRLSLALVDGTRQEVSYRRVPVPFICPERR
jgi:hypothetical protein